MANHNYILRVIRFDRETGDMALGFYHARNATDARIRCEELQRDAFVVAIVARSTKHGSDLIDWQRPGYTVDVDSDAGEITIDAPASAWV